MSKELYFCARCGAEMKDSASLRHVVIGPLGQEHPTISGLLGYACSACITSLLDWWQVGTTLVFTSSEAAS